MRFLLASILIFPGLLNAAEVESVYSSFDSNNMSESSVDFRSSGNTNFFDGELGLGTSLDVSVSRASVFLKDTEDNEYTIGKFLNGKQGFEIDSASFSMSQGIDVRSGLSVQLGQSESTLLKSLWRGVTAFRWFQEDTLKMSLGYNYAKSNPVINDYVDVDSVRVVTPEVVDKRTYSLSAMHFTTPTLITMGSLYYMTQSDRPDTGAVDFQLRKFITAYDATVFLKMGYLDNSGDIEPITTYGEIKSNQVEVIWNQRFIDRYIASFGVRSYQQIEVERANEINSPLGSDFIHTKLTYRDYDKSWLDPSNEYYFFGGSYVSSAEQNSYVLGIGLKRQL